MAEEEGRDEAAEAFDRLSGKVERVIQVLETLEAVPQEARAVDYTPTLGALDRSVRALAEGVGVMHKHPAMQLSPEAWVSRMEQAASSSRRAVEQDFRRAETTLAQAAHQLEEIRRQARTAEVQNRRLLEVGAGSLIAGVVLWAALAGPIVRKLPASWAAPEKMAAAVMAEDRASAGQHLIASVSPQGWAETVKAIKLYRANRNGLAACGLAAARAKKAQRCSVKVEPLLEGER